MKKFLPVLALISSVSMTSIAMGEYNPDKQVSPDEISTKTLIQEENDNDSENTIEEVNTETSEQTKEDSIKTFNLIDYNGNLLFPVREVAESLDYIVEWDSNTKTIYLVNGPQYITLTIGVNGYTFSKTAPMPLSQEPVIIEDKAYAPVGLLTEIMELPNVVINENNTLTISLSNLVESEEIENIEDNTETSNISNVEIISINEDENSILVKDSVKGEVILNIDSEKTIIEEGVDLKEGATILVEYGESMTLSLPPVNNPIKISKLS